MKRIFTTVIALTIATFGFSQSIHIYEGGTDYTNGTINVTIEPLAQYLNDLEIHNTTGVAIDYQVNRTISHAFHILNVKNTEQVIVKACLFFCI